MNAADDTVVPLVCNVNVVGHVPGGALIHVPDHVPVPIVAILHGITEHVTPAIVTLFPGQLDVESWNESPLTQVTVVPDTLTSVGPVVHGVLAPPQYGL